MYFEDEKENMTDDGVLEDLDLDLDAEDDKSVTWDDLLDDDADIDLSSAKKNVGAVDNLLADGDDDLALLSDDDSDIPAPVKAQRKDAFEVFGGDTADGGNDGGYSQKDTVRGDTITPDLTSNRPSARTKAGIEEDDDIYFEPNKAKKSSGFVPALVGALVAIAFVGGLVYLFMTYGKPLLGDAGALMNNQAEQQSPMGLETNVPSADINNKEAENKAADAEANKAKAEEQKLVTFSVQNGGRINPFIPPSGFESSKYTIASDYEILSPPEEVPGEEVADEAKKLMDITVSGILFDSVKPSAIVNVNGSDFYVQVGDMVDEFQVIAINRQYVAIKDGTNIFKAQVGESFGGTQVGGMASKQTGGKYAGARQYTSSSDVEVSAK